MWGVAQESVPEDALLRTYQGGRHPERWGRYGDCFSVSVDREVTLGEFVFAFYTSWVFRIERVILRLLTATASTDEGARAVAEGLEGAFAVWVVGERTSTQLLMCDRYERTRSWFRVVPMVGGTKLQFGSAVVAEGNDNTGAKVLGGRFRLLLGFHVLYSRVLLNAAKRGVMKTDQRKVAG
jgi:hypothetical protein